uniref:F-box associated beta-propeller type 3 domain-containing protein n=1 Tax=Triticum urartu TaxID=4572 RepID=A0A8R7PMM3_TRIUA
MPDTMLEDLPEWLVVDEILVWLPPKDVLRCRAVRKSWRVATSTDRFILDHHRRQPLLPIIEHDEGIYCLAAAGAQKILRLVVRYSPDPVSNIAFCDGLLILSRQSSFYICNPATRKCALLPCPPLRPGFRAPNVVAFYRHDASPREYRVLWVFSAHMARRTTYEPPRYFILPVGSDQPRCIQWPTVLQSYPASCDLPPVHHRGALHWELSLGITVLDTVTETFRHMSYPAQLHGGVFSLFHLGGDLALRHTSGDCLTQDVWVLQDYDAEMWAFRHRIDLRAMEVSPPLPLDFADAYFAPMMAVINERELLISMALTACCIVTSRVCF